MTWGRIAVYYAVGLTLGAYFLLFEWRPGPGQAPPRKTHGPAERYEFLPLSRDRIHGLELQRGDAKIVLQLDGGAWRVLKPSGAPITSDLISSFVDNLTPERAVPVIDDDPEDLSDYGLADPASVISIMDAGGKKRATIFLGSRNPTNSAVYARKENSPEIVLLGYTVEFYSDLLFEAAKQEKG